MQTFFLHSLVCSGIYFCVLANDNRSENSYASVTSTDLPNGSVHYLETTRISVYEEANQDPTMSFREYFVKPEPLVSDPLIEKYVPWNVSHLLGVLRRKRNLPDTGFTHENKMMLLQLHNVYRGNVTPPAGNMAYMEWDEELARLAQIWSEKCVFAHGLPELNYTGAIGQNLYMGPDRTGYSGLYLWYEEYRNYDLRKVYCLPRRECNHYVQMAWALTDKVGCGVAKCNMSYLITCHYSPDSKVNMQMYRVAKPCSQCPEEGSLCINNLCMTREQCERNPFDCQLAECNLECLNCGLLDEEGCLCECADGWDSPDCSALCTDNHGRCGKSPGFPNKSTCSNEKNAVADKHCRKMCETCHGVNTSLSNDTCCDGKLCDSGFVLDTAHENSCQCKLLCPGPLCDKEEDGKLQAVMQSGVNYSHRVVLVTFNFWIIFAISFLTIIV